MGIGISGSKFVQSLVKLKAQRVMRKWVFGPLGQENLRYCIQQNRSFMATYPPEVLRAAIQLEFGHIAPEQLAMAKNFDCAVVYGWIPDEYRQTIESLPGGREWVMCEMEILRPMIFEKNG